MKFLKSVFCFLILHCASCTNSEPSPSELKELSEQRYKIGAHYYVWYPDNFEEGTLRSKLVPPQEPVLGHYESADPKVAEQHIAWASEYGIDFFTLDYWPNVDHRNKRIDEGFLKARNIGDIKFCIFYESWNLRWLAHYGATVFTTKASRQFRREMKMFAEKYFSHPSYLKIDGKPVVVLYLTRTFAKHYEIAITKAREEVRKLGYEIYFIADEIFWDVTEQRNDKNSFRNKVTAPQIKRIELFDAITSYNLYTRRYRNKQKGYGEENTFFKDAGWLFDRYLNYEGMNKPLAPVLIPGYNDRGVRRGNYIFPRQWEEGGPEGGFLDHGFKEMGFPYMDPELEMIFITSWNEWNEDTAIEPLKPSPPTNKDISEDSYHTGGFSYSGHGTAYLEVVQKNVVAVAGSAPKDTWVIAWKDGKAVTADKADFNGKYTLSRKPMPPGKYMVGSSLETAKEVEVGLDKTEIVDF